MATKKDAPEPLPTLALLEFGGTSMVLPADLAAQAFQLLCHGELVEYKWNNSSYKRITDPGRAPTLKVFTVAQYATLALNDEVE